MAKVNYKIIPGESEKTFDTNGGEIKGDSVLMFRYPGCMQLYINVPIKEAKERFEKMMQNRNEFEAKVEGWDVEVVELKAINGEAFMAEPGHMQKIVCEMQKAMNSGASFGPGM